MAKRKPLSAEKTNILLLWGLINIVLPVIFHVTARPHFFPLGFNHSVLLYLLILTFLNIFLIVRVSKYKWLFGSMILLNALGVIGGTFSFFTLFWNLELAYAMLDIWVNGTKD